MPNPRGVNGYGVKFYPADEVLRESLLEYARCGLTKKEKLARLHSDHGLNIGISILKKIEKRLDIPSVRRPPPPELVRQLIIDEADNDTMQNNGPEYVRVVLRNQGIMIARQRIRDIMHEHFPLGFDHRCPGKKGPLIRKSLTAAGPYHEISSDGHEKLSQQALDMGDIGLPIYGYKDKWSGALLKLSVVPNSCSSAAVGHLYLDLIEDIGGIPIQATTDKGSEIAWQYAFQDALREIYAPNLGSEAFPTYAIIPSTNNTVIESFWRWMKMKSGLNIKNHILRGKRENIYHPWIPYHKNLFNWIFPPLVQAELDSFRMWWNHHRVRSQKEKEMPSGHIPIDALKHPQLYGGMDCLIPVPTEAVHELRLYLTEEVGSRESHLEWVSDDFSAIVADVYQQIGKPLVSFQNGWEVFRQMSFVIARGFPAVEVQ